jgi:BirA family transcriptional regulator, biotin operon repressor / biotin---[acetyl-CoA-carboxylase] ligase
MLSESTLSEILARLGHQAPVRFDEVTGSTNATASVLAGRGAPEWTLVAAGHQTEGRGRLRRTWVDQPGRSLLFSLVLRPQLSPDLAGLVPLLAGAAMARASSAASGAKVGCKWPNDLLAGERKVGGILGESSTGGGRLTHVVLGIGVNLDDPPPGLAEAGAVGGVDSAALLEAFLREFDEGYRPEDPLFAAGAVEAAREVSITLGRLVRATAVDGSVVEGLAVDLDTRGGLVIEAKGKRMVVAFGDVGHVEPLREVAPGSGPE